MYDILKEYKNIEKIILNRNESSQYKLVINNRANKIINSIIDSSQEIDTSSMTLEHYLSSCKH